MKKIIIGGVYEHFNFPWQDAIEKELFSKEGIDLEWNTISGGTGEMIKLLQEQKLDLAVMLTEGLFIQYHNNRSIIPIQFHVNSPLQWGIHTRTTEQYTVNDFSSLRFAVSRLNSGSHLMALVHAKQNFYTLNKNQFILCNSLPGGLEALRNNKADVFLWEKYTTEPFLNEFGLKRIGIVPTPWPPFCLAANKHASINYKTDIEKIKKIISTHNKTIKSDIGSIPAISKKFEIDFNRIEKWFTETEWNYSIGITNEEQDQILTSLYDLNLIESYIPFTNQKK